MRGTRGYRGQVVAMLPRAAGTCRKAELRFLDLVDIPSGLYNGTLYLGISNSFLNCIIYSISHKAFREGFRQLAKKFCDAVCCRKRTQHVSSAQWRHSPCTIRCAPSSSTNTSIQLNKTKSSDA